MSAATPKPLLLHEALLPYALLTLSLLIPSRRLSLLVLPALLYSYLHLLRTSSTSPAPAFVIGAFSAYHSLHSLTLLLLRDPRGTFTRSSPTGAEAYPRALPARVLWSLDLATSMRGVGWSWQIRPIPRDDTVGSPWVFLRRRVCRLLLIWAWLDATMFWMHVADAGYFVPLAGGRRVRVYSGLFSGSCPPVGVGGAVEGGAGAGVLWTVGRSVLQGAAIYTAMNGVYTILAVLFVGAGVVLGGGEGGRWTDWRRWPDIFGSWSGGKWGGGLKGYWGTAWHGLFKYVFTAPTLPLLRALHLRPSSPAAYAILLLAPFTLSALLHQAGTHTLSTGGLGSARFFLLQPAGILLEAAFLRFYRRRWLPGWAEWIMPYVWVLAWFAATGGSFWEDLRWGGVWSVQLVPVSVWKGVTGRGWWMWGREERGWWEWSPEVGGWAVRI